MQEQNAWKINGFFGVLVILLLAGLAAYLFIVPQAIFYGVLVVIVALLLGSGLAIVQPNQAKAIIFFGQYLGTIRESGLWLSVPLTVAKKVSLRVRNFNSKTLKVNDVEGNPIEIAAVVVFKVVDTAKAIFDVDNYEEFVEIQSETALRHVATKYP
ncbi:MAG TPA: SPFH domain-containing protein, partial [Clostridia bacterium]|nr:SPFH domain-containing protein [Clostridia bacterium]